MLLRLSDREFEALAVLADRAGVSLPRYLVEAGLSGSAASAAQRRRVEKELIQSRVVLKASGNNVNQLAKWANTNGAFPEEAHRAVTELVAAADIVCRVAAAVGSELGTAR